MSSSIDSNKVSLKKTTLVMVVVGLLLATEVFSGVFRYYLDRAGLAFLIYTAKAAVLLCIAVKLPLMARGPLLWLVLLGIGVSSVVALAHGATLQNVGFAVFVYSPLWFGMLYGARIAEAKRALFVLMLAAWFASVLGIALDMSTEVPWKGYAYQLAGADLQANREWNAYGIDRIAGFSRLSATLAMMIAIFALYLHYQIRSRSIQLLLFLSSTVAIALTTTKSVVPAYVIAILAGILFQRPKVVNALFGSIVAIGLLLPLSSVVFRYSGVSRGNDLLSSFDARLLDTWPGFFEIVEKAGGVLLGTGFGTVGAAAVAFPISALAGTRLGGLGVADNTALYLWGMLGVLGVVLYSGIYLVMHRLRLRRSPHAYGMLSVTVCLCFVSWTTDILEASVAALSLGLAASYALSFRRHSAGRSCPVTASGIDR